MSSSAKRKATPLFVFAAASASLALVAAASYGVLCLLRDDTKQPKPLRQAAPANQNPKGFAVSISIANIIMWNPSTDKAHPTFAFHPESLRFLTQLLQSPLRPTVTLIATVSSKEQEDQIMHLLDSNALFSKGLDERRVLFCDTVQGRVHLVKHLGSLVHVDDDDQVLMDLLPHVKRLIRVKRTIRVSIEADIRRMSQSSVRSGRVSPPPRTVSPLSATSSPETLVPATTIPIEDDEVVLRPHQRGYHEQRPPVVSEYKFPIVSSPRRRSPVSAGGVTGALFRTTSQASFKTPSSIASSLSRGSVPAPVVAAVDPVAEATLDALRRSGVVEFVEGIELSRLLM
ncbi:hypothetical protein HDU98_003177 [Podochytrium sp. JEL0797]|nr:hypothetical protein HDU98_003177 [Podochytrium sp. JEL0797]